VTFCVFTVAACQRFSSIVIPVSVSFDVEGQRTSKLLMLRRAFAFDRRGGSKKNLVAISESINDARLCGVVRRHLHFHPVTNREANKTLAHFPGDMRENEMIIREGDSKHGSRKHRLDDALYCDGFFRIQHIDFGRVGAAAPTGRSELVWCCSAESPTIINSFLPAKTSERTLPAALRTWTLFAWTRFVNS